MQSSRDRQRLMRMYSDDPSASTWFLVCRCCAGLAIVALIAVTGLSEQDKARQSAQTASMTASRDAVAQGSSTALGEQRHDPGSASRPIVAADIESGQAVAKQATLPLSGP